MNLLVIDNYDSFTYNLVNLLYEAGAKQVTVKRNDKISLEEVGKYEKILISPGPGLPEEAGITLPLIRRYAASKSILGVCLGHQAIGVVFGSPLANLQAPLHGVSSTLQIHQDDYLFKNCPKQFSVAHYHSWVVQEVLPPLECLATNPQHLVMAMRHKQYDVRGLQFHPESILTEFGLQIIKNWIQNNV